MIGETVLERNQYVHDNYLRGLVHLMDMQTPQCQDFGVKYIENALNSKNLAEIVSYNLKEFCRYPCNFNSCLEILTHLSLMDKSQALKVLLEENNLMYLISELLKIVGQ